MNEQKLGILTIAVAAVALIALTAQYHKTSGTTLRAPVIWSFIAFGFLGVSILPTVFGKTRPEWLQYIAAVALFSPEMALLGAKRPQDKGWQFIVASLILVLIIPVGQAMVFSIGSPLVLHWPWKVFLCTLIGVGLLNHAWSWMFFPGALICCGQVLLMSSQLWLPILFGAYQTLIATCLLTAAVFLAIFRSRNVSKTSAFDRVWIDFRDGFGNLWALRILERINYLAEQENWSVELNWSGFRQMNQTALPDEEIEKCLRTLLRRFVSPEWIDRRVEKTKL